MCMYMLDISTRQSHLYYERHLLYYMRDISQFTLMRHTLYYGIRHTILCYILDAVDLGLIPHVLFLKRKKQFFP
jgi:hypothetical protein